MQESLPDPFLLRQVRLHLNDGQQRLYYRKQCVGMPVQHWRGDCCVINHDVELSTAMLLRVDGFAAGDGICPGQVVA